MYEFLLLDMDDTILDFKKAEEVALKKTLESFSLAPTQEVCARYSQINQSYWEMLERKEITRERLKVQRFGDLFQEYGIEADSALCAQRYVNNLAQGHFFLPGAEEAVRRLSEKYKLYLVSNGATDVQMSRLESAGIGKYFQEVFISQQVGVDKPDKLFFERCFAQIPEFDKQKAIIVGDSLTSDILGGRNAGIATCWINPTKKPARADIPADYEIEALSQLEALLETL
ncbi:MAG: YjjG family noncanonical pyrimidine nucleotidase [Oscillospiraceae bacterium]|nr:YjjG family noncanonical pyrimidine nucleotidase [Oscillospiraceae bacterium]